MIIYVVTTIRSRTTLFDGGSRVVGYFETLEEATQCVIENFGDIHEEGHYPHAVIEEVEPGLYPHIQDERWFCWDTKAKGYLRIAKPAEHNGVCNFSIG